MISALPEFVREVLDHRPTPVKEFDQLPATYETMLKRLAFLEEHQLARGRRTLFLGDDDFTSVLVSRFLRPGEVFVLECDPRIITRLETIAKRYDLMVNFLNYNVVTPLPAHCVGRFDLCFTDPPYTRSGFATFLKRSVKALRQAKQSTLIAALSVADVGHEQWDACIQSALSLGLVLKATIEDFNVYDLTQRRWESNREWRFTSSLLWFERCPNITDTVDNDAAPAESLYQYQYGQ